MSTTSLSSISGTERTAETSENEGNDNELTVQVGEKGTVSSRIEGGYVSRFKKQEKFQPVEKGRQQTLGKRNSVPTTIIDVSLLSSSSSAVENEAEAPRYRDRQQTTRRSMVYALQETPAWPNALASLLPIKVYLTVMVSKNFAFNSRTDVLLVRYKFGQLAQSGSGAETKKKMDVTDCGDGHFVGRVMLEVTKDTFSRTPVLKYEYALRTADSRDLFERSFGSKPFWRSVRYSGGSQSAETSVQEAIERFDIAFAPADSAQARGFSPSDHDNQLLVTETVFALYLLLPKVSQCIAADDAGAGRHVLQLPLPLPLPLQLPLPSPFQPATSLYVSTRALLDDVIEHCKQLGLKPMRTLWNMLQQHMTEQVAALWVLMGDQEKTPGLDEALRRFETLLCLLMVAGRFELKKALSDLNSRLKRQFGWSITIFLVLFTRLPQKPSDMSIEAFGAYLHQWYAPFVSDAVPLIAKTIRTVAFDLKDKYRFCSVYLLPAYHVLAQLVSPYVTPEWTGRERKISWWGADSRVKDVISSLKNTLDGMKAQQAVAVCDPMLTNVKPLLQLDALMQRCFLYLLKDELLLTYIGLEVFTLEHVVARMSMRLENALSTKNALLLVSSKALPVLRDEMRPVAARLPLYDDRGTPELHSASGALGNVHSAADAALDMASMLYRYALEGVLSGLNGLLDSAYSAELFELAEYVFATAYCLSSHYMSVANYDVKFSTKVEQLSNWTCTFLSRSLVPFFQSVDKTEMDMRAMLMQVKLWRLVKQLTPRSDVTAAWQSMLRTAFQHTLSKRKASQKLQLYCRLEELVASVKKATGESICTDLQIIIKTLAFQEVDAGKTEILHLPFVRLDSTRYFELLARFIDQTLPDREQCDRSTLLYALTSHTFHDLLHRLYECAAHLPRLSLVSPGCVKRLNSFVLALHPISYEALVSGGVTLRNLEMIVNFAQQYATCAIAVSQYMRACQTAGFGCDAASDLVVDDGSWQQVDAAQAVIPTEAEVYVMVKLRDYEMRYFLKILKLVNNVVRVFNAYRDLLPILKAKARIDHERIALRNVVHVRNEYKAGAVPQLNYLSIDDVTMRLLEAYGALTDSHLLRSIVEQILRDTHAVAEAKNMPVDLEHDHSECHSTQECVSKELRLAVSFIRPCIVYAAHRFESIQNGTISVQQLQQCITTVFADRLDHFESELRYLDKKRRSLDIAKRFHDSQNAPSTATLSQPPCSDWIAVRVRQCSVLRKAGTLNAVCNLINTLRSIFKLTGDFSILDRIINAETIDNRSLSSFDVDTLDDFENLLSVAVNDQQLLALRVFLERDVVELVSWLRQQVPTPAQFATLLEMAIAKVQDDERTESFARIYCFEQAINGYQSLVYLPLLSGLNEVLDAFRKVFANLSSDKRLPKQIQDAAWYLEWLKSIKNEHCDVERSVTQKLVAFEENGSFFHIGLRQPHDVMTGNLLKCTVNEKCQQSEGDDDDDDAILSSTDYTLEQLKLMKIKAILLSGMGSMQRNVDKDKQEQALAWFANLVDSVENLVTQLNSLLCADALVFRNFVMQMSVKSSASSITVSCNHPAMAFHNSVLVQDAKDLLIQTDAIAAALRSCSRRWEHNISELRFRYPEVNVFTKQQLTKMADSLNQLWLLVQTNASVDAKHVQFEDSQVTLATISAGFRIVCTNELVVGALQRVLEKESDKSSLVDSNGLQSCSTDVLCELIVSSWNNCLERKCETRLLNLETLCAVLRELLNTARKQHLQSPIRRRSLQSLNEHAPNLLVCSNETQIIKLILSIYQMASVDLNCCVLPTAEEVLLCTCETEREHVDLFLKRALLPTSGTNELLFCIAFTPSANVELIRFAGESFSSLIRNPQTRTTFRLVVICLNERAYSFSSNLEVVAVSAERFINVDDRDLASFVRQQLEFSVLLKNFPNAPHVKVPASKCENNHTVRVIESNFPGSGKSLYVQRRIEAFRRLRLRSSGSGSAVTSENERSAATAIALYQRVASTDELFSNLPADHSSFLYGKATPRIYHIDIINTNNGLEYILFKLLILGQLTNSTGLTWLRSPFDLYLIEHTTRFVRVSEEDSFDLAPINSLLSVLPSMLCNSPTECAYWLQRSGTPLTVMQFVDERLFHSPVYQVPFEYLRSLQERDSSRPAQDPSSDVELFLQIIKSYWNGHEPTWYEVRNFLHFLYAQLECFKQNSFVQASDQLLPGFREFILRYIVAMSREFATRSLNISEDTNQTGGISALINMANLKDAENLIRQYQLRRTWEVTQHPYVFFNGDQQTMTFFDFQIRNRRCTKQEIAKDVPVEIINGMADIKVGVKLFMALREQMIPFGCSFDKFPAQAKLAKLIMLWKVFGVDFQKQLSIQERRRFFRVLEALERNPEFHFKPADSELIDVATRRLDPDVTYELTMDNTRKILAIFMRLRCRVPVIVMGETGCGKTTMIEYLSRLIAMNSKVRNLVKVKIHGGVKEKDLERIVAKAERLTAKNYEEHRVETVLFLDEANSSEVIHLIKEMVCDHRLKARSLSAQLRIVCAVNPYRMHKQSVIDRLEHAGLGYHRRTTSLPESFGPIPMRHLVYRVHPLPHSLLPFVWDFGRLDQATELLYIRRIANRMLLEISDSQRVSVSEESIDAICRLVNFCQRFMNEGADESVFVSLRNVLRIFKIFSWMLRHSDLLFREMDDKLAKWWRDRFSNLTYTPIAVTLRCFILTIMVCYYVSLQDSRQSFCEKFAQELASAYPAENTDHLDHHRVLREFCTLQDVVMEHCNVAQGVAPNGALKENVLLMVICLDLRIPLFIIGKPGTSKSLSREIVRNAMQGHHSTSPFFASLKKAHFVNLQCNQSTTAENITSVFRQCAQMQKQKRLDEYVGVAMLDELGLAESSPHLPLKTLHSLLDDGCAEDEEDSEGDGFDIPDYRRVAFVGLSNWSVDPAKTNRGILVQRAKFTVTELELTADGLCRSDGDYYVRSCIQPYLRSLCTAYRNLYEKVDNDFFGLRDFYALITMIVQQVATQQILDGDYYASRLSWRHVRYAVLRNFDATATQINVQPLAIFADCLKAMLDDYTYDCSDDTNEDEMDRIISQVLDENTLPDEPKEQLVDSARSISRYPLFIVDDACSTYVLTNLLKSRGVKIIFGSAFSDDRGSNSRLGRDIYRIKMCIELGRTCALMNVPELYDCLYDALNQSFSYLGGDRYVDLSLGGQRMKCKLHERFRLIVIASRSQVAQFPIPLLNRLEKHRFRLSAILSQHQRAQVAELKSWLTAFTGLKNHPMFCTASQTNSQSPISECERNEICDSLVGLDDSMLPAIVLAASTPENNNVLPQCIRLALDCATAKSIIRHCASQKGNDANYDESPLSVSTVERLYWVEQNHGDIFQLVTTHLSDPNLRTKLLRITTFSSLLNKSQVQLLQSALENKLNKSVQLSFTTPTQFATLHSFENYVTNALESHSVGRDDSNFRLLILQCEYNAETEQLIFCSQQAVESCYAQRAYTDVGIVFVTKLSDKRFRSFRYGVWRSTHLDALIHPASIDFSELKRRTIQIGHLVRQSDTTWPLTKSMFHALVDEERDVAVIDQMLSDLARVLDIMEKVQIMPHESIVNTMEQRFKMDTTAWSGFSQPVRQFTFRHFHAVWLALMFVKINAHGDVQKCLPTKLSAPLNERQVTCLQCSVNGNFKAMMFLLFEAFLEEVLAFDYPMQISGEASLVDFLKSRLEEKHANAISSGNAPFYAQILEIFDDPTRPCSCKEEKLAEDSDATHEFCPTILVENAASVYKVLFECSNELHNEVMQN